MITRRQWIGSTSAVAASAAIAPNFARAQQKTVLDVYTDGDTNVSDFLANIIKPAFEKAEPSLSIKVTITRGAGGGNVLIGDRALAALKAKADPQVDYFEEIDPADVKGGVEAGLFAKVSKDVIPNMANSNPLSFESDYKMAYRGSQVLIAYDSAKIPEAEAPRTFADLVKWVKAHPGRFTYGRPDKGGSGKNFVVRAVHEANGRDPSLFKVNNFDAKLADERFAKAWELLRDIHPHTYGNGAYPAGNTPTLQLLANGAVDMISAWSDQALEALKKGVLPPSVKLLQFKDLALCGGFAFSAIPTNGKNYAGALKFANFMLSKEVQTLLVREIGAFPGVTWDSLDPALRKEYIDIIPVSIPTFPSGDWSKAMNAGWYKNVATNIAQ